MSAVFEVKHPGLLTMVQDKGRYGYQQYGMPPAGAADPFSLQAGNLLLGNNPGAAALEVNFLGPTLKLLRDVPVVITGGDLGPTVDGNSVPMWEVLFLQQGQVLAFETMKTGCRSYITVAGGIDVPVVMGSRSTYLRGKLGGYQGRQLQAGDVLHSGRPAVEGRQRVGKRLAEEMRPLYASEVTLRVIMGPQDDYFFPAAVKTFLSAGYTVSVDSDRMGYRLEGPGLKHKKTADIISDVTSPGSVQVPGSGMPIVLLADRQTTGGYTKIATVISADIPSLAQSKPGDKIRFRQIDLRSAYELRRQQKAVLKSLR